jgi:hypothetical protein
MSIYITLMTGVRGFPAETSPGMAAAADRVGYFVEREPSIVAGKTQSHAGIFLQHYLRPGAAETCHVARRSARAQQKEGGDPATLQAW